MNDPYFRVSCLNRTEQPQTLIWQAMHQDYSEQCVAYEDPPCESEAGRIAVKRLLQGGRGHYGPLEHPSISFSVGWSPHSVMQQARTHRVGVSFDVQSMRYTGQRVAQVDRGDADIEEVFYLRPVGSYSDRSGKRYEYTEEQREYDLDRCRIAAEEYRYRIEMGGFAEEHARGLLPFDFRQHFVVSFSLRALMHFLDLRAKADAQWEIQQLCELMWPHFQAWAPEIASWYRDHRWGKARLAP
jgi:thymidylate synthase (FAD)